MIEAAALERFVAEVLARLGVPAGGAKIAAEALVAADLEGMPSHGAMLLPMYVDRLLAGSVSRAVEPKIVHDGGFALVLDAGHMLGQLSSHRAVGLARERAAAHGIAVIAVRNGFHFGAAGYWARALAASGLAGIAMCNTRPLMPAPGGAERVVGNNPLAIALPGDGGAPLTVDLALSAGAMGKIRLAAAAGRPIPEGWAADAEGRPTTDAAAAIKGMLLPAAGPKGFGLAVAIDLLCGALSGGAIGDEVSPLYGDPSKPYGCAQLFIALDPARFGAAADFANRVARFGARVRASRRAPGVDRIFAPGDLERSRREAHAGRCPVGAEVLESLVQCGERAGVSAAALAAARNVH